MSGWFWSAPQQTPVEETTTEKPEDVVVVEKEENLPEEELDQKAESREDLTTYHFTTHETTSVVLDPVYEGDVNLVLRPRGNGGFYLNLPDDEIEGGEERGVNAVDLQQLRLFSDKVASGNYSSIGGGANNQATGFMASVGGGGNNQANGATSHVGGGDNNMATAAVSSIGAGQGNVASGYSSRIGGGINNQATAAFSTISGGNSNCAYGHASSVAGGELNLATASSSFIGGGSRNVAAGSASATIGGSDLSTSAYSSIAVGNYNQPGKDGFSSERLLMVGNGTSQARSNAFTVTRDGGVYAHSYISDGNNIAYYFETIHDEELPLGTSVFLSNGKIRQASRWEVPIGVVTSRSAYALNCGDEWHGKYMTDRDGNPLYQEIEEMIEEPVIEMIETTISVDEERQDGEGDTFIVRSEQVRSVPQQAVDRIPVFDDEGNFLEDKEVPRVKRRMVTRWCRKLSPDFNPDLTFIPRSKRPSWHPIAVVGVVRVLTDTSTSPRWELIGHDPSDSRYNLYLIR